MGDSNSTGYQIRNIRGHPSSEGAGSVETSHLGRNVADMRKGRKKKGERVVSKRHCGKPECRPAVALYLRKPLVSSNRCHFGAVQGLDLVLPDGGE